MKTAIGITTSAGITASGWAANRIAITTPNTALTRVTRKKMISRNSVEARGLITFPDSVPMFCPRLRADTTMEPKSCTPAAKMVPSATHSSAGSQPQ